ncbi:unnamed protein product [Mytilus edulis]|uniref:Uncharacterized protein n=1 Tax=Mytilus edulis TaxID=6550 RepID=A0A8S3R2R9_MYTED|nr:unnamed protein product [Mytilus edulis]
MWNVQTQDGHYVLTVPATWDDQAHIFMRKAAEQAGISGNQLTIALEHEAALTYCQVLRPYDQRDTNYSSIFHAIRRDKKYMVVDLGGILKSVITQRRSDGCLEEVVQPSRCYLGGTDIDIGIVRFLENLFGEQVMKELRLTELEDYNTLMYELEVKKQLIKSDAISDIAITMPFSLIEITKIHCGGIAAAINTSKHSEVSDIQQIIMVGGFAECELVQKAMEDRFPNIEIFLPEKAGLAVLKGAVMYGHQPQIRRHQNSAQVASVRTTSEQPIFPWYVQQACSFILHLLGILYPLLIVYGGLQFVVVLCCVAEMAVVKQTDIQQPTDFIARLKTMISAIYIVVSTCWVITRAEHGMMKEASTTISHYALLSAMWIKTHNHKNTEYAAFRNQSFQAML